MPLAAHRAGDRQTDAAASFSPLGRTQARRSCAGVAVAVARRGGSFPHAVALSGSPVAGPQETF